MKRKGPFVSLLPYPFVCCIDIVRNAIFLLSYNFGAWVSIVGASHRRTWGVALVYHKVMYKKILIYHKQQIFSYRIEEAVSLKFLPLNIEPDIDLMCPTSSFFTNIAIGSSWMSAIRRPCRIRRGGIKLLCARLCACRLLWHPAFTEIHR